MRVPQIRLASQVALISLETDNARQEIRQAKATQEIRQEQADLSIHTRSGRLTIDQSQAWYDIGLKSAKVSYEDFAKEGYQRVLSGIARRRREGDEQMKIEDGDNPLVSQAVRNAHPSQKNFNIGWIPAVFSVKTNYQSAEVDIRVDVNQPLIRNTPNQVRMTYTPGQVTTGIRQENDLTIDFENLVYRNFQFELEI